MPQQNARPAISSYRDLTVWQRSMDVVIEIYAISKRFPKDERFGLTAQVRRAAVSVPANISEGNSRHSKAEYRHFVSIAHGSVAELETELAIAERLGFVTGSELAAVREHAGSISRMLTSLRKSLRD